MSTQAELRKLADKNPYGFLEAFGKAAAAMAAAEYNARRDPGDRELTGEDILDEDYNDNVLTYIDNETGSTQVEGFTLNCVNSIGGGEGDGEKVVRVWAIVFGAKRVKPTAKNKYAQFEGGEVLKYVRATGYYQSYEGTEFDDTVEEVFPQEVKVIHYFNKAELKKVKA